MSDKKSADSSALQTLQSSGPIPRHIAIIMDGNGRWASERGLPRVKGHYQGVSAVREIVTHAAELGVEFLTLYTFSTENWSRPDREVNALMKLLIRTLKQELQTFMKNGIRLQSIGEISRLPPAARKELSDAVEESRGNTGMTLVLALSYSGRREIVLAARKMASDVAAGKLQPDQINSDTVARALDTSEMPDPDLLIRTGGDLRISNYLLWQLAYSELYFTDTYWPDFSRSDLDDALIDFQSRERRFGRVPIKNSV
jgi:undecaprenyl diphosphate synthase